MLGFMSLTNLRKALTGQFYFTKDSDRLATLVNLDLSNASSAISAAAIDWSAANVFTKTIGANTTFTFSNTSEKEIVVVVTASGSYTATWPTAKWASGTPPTQTASGTDVYAFRKVGSTIYGRRVIAAAA